MSAIAGGQATNPDDLYDAIVHMYDGLDAQRSAVVSAKLILILAARIADRTVIDEAVAMARSFGLQANA